MKLHLCLSTVQLRLKGGVELTLWWQHPLVQHRSQQSPLLDTVLSHFRSRRIPMNPTSIHQNRPSNFPDV
jgi:hypothetical protein